jgi:hypothetical protein
MVCKHSEQSLWDMPDTIQFTKRGYPTLEIQLRGPVHCHCWFICKSHGTLQHLADANDGTVCCFSADDRHLIRSADVILYDECSMVHHDVADTLERSLRDLMGDSRPFGGKVVVFMGDFKQLFTLPNPRICDGTRVHPAI